MLGSIPALNPTSLLGPIDRRQIAGQKDERPVGAPAARAWGWRETQSEGSAVPIVYAALASSRTSDGAVLTAPRIRGQLPITIVIVLPAPVSVDSPLVPSRTVLPALSPRTLCAVLSYSALARKLKIGKAKRFSFALSFSRIFNVI
jgi:hypothetical protein